MENDLFNMKWDDISVKQMNPLTLAFVGDAVYEVFVRTYLVNRNRDMKVHNLHVEAIKFVKAHSQSEIIKKLETQLSEEELYFFKRGRNAKSATVPKNADVQEYRFATGLETLVGFLYLTRKLDRLNSLFKSIITLKNQGEF
ncbi:Mini-ribonuclease 3 [Clostridium luticellarii]|jgi:ribonuclease-3 family protein|uniref:Mini-ribonuclease 3 n=1 Tax=Clostridium luticellarii TaxID=1691940 RepID=A0A2T0BS39_9CLOT|nr:ribonuclease III domain-containing protein [Clostridium luticellarii]MCI1944667.1 Mini-ribonuclease 3 [Clostridium luticellarii]MCI1968164.1 Mini-ribonuclease 3 [Clostridium luticellarii]MCI1995291.1 Mini-ribonuclease 3 [Clostridium luticellarii]MCI2039712.1 Mini-ribonuclease 3 [Clostridium luticellarii]PRR86693.1 Mini-ribonuclease 3 [Clostridium luticellarii]